ncbi:hypothetical protein Cni_G05167 [Canna indica]|uniref:Yip1 domain-containing protein n=1 Tax=Canna indica TaxID=4628 RepID=A0AAQ3Q4P0_9LILI|nr:hypothetical protein Cni_G05167 [Canna indica]
MPAMDYQGSSVPFASIGRSILSIRREQVHSLEGGHHDSPYAHESELDAFQKHLTELFVDLSASTTGDEVLSLSWLCKLLDGFLVCQEEFRMILFSCKESRQAQLSRPPLDRFLSDFFDRAVKALDVCNAVRDGVDQLRRWRQLLQIAIAALAGCGGDRPLGEGQLRRARKALADLTILMLDDKEATGGSSLNLRNRSFGRAGKDPPHHHRVGSGGSASSVGHYRSLSWSVSRSWSAARQLQAIGNNLTAPRANEVTATSGLVVPVFSMSTVLFFVMWVLVAAIPCQDRGLQTHFSVPRNFQWAASITSLHERILEESKRKDRKNSCGLLKEIHQMEKCSRQLAELLDQLEFPLTDEKEMELKQGVEELLEVCNSLKEGLDPLERQEFYLVSIWLIALVTVLIRILMQSVVWDIAGTSSKAALATSEYRCKHGTNDNNRSALALVLLVLLLLLLLPVSLQIPNQPTPSPSLPPPIARLRAHCRCPATMSQGDTIPLHSSSQSDIDEIENLIRAGAHSATVLPARPPSPPRAYIPVSHSYVPSPVAPSPSYNKTPPFTTHPPPPPPLPTSGSPRPGGGVATDGFGSPPDTLTEPVWDTVKRDLTRIVTNLKLVVFPNPFREDPGKALKDWDLWGPFFFIIFLGLTLSWSASVKKSEVFAVAFAVLAAGAVILTLNALLLGGQIIFFQSLSLLGYCLFPLDIGALICLLKSNVVMKMVVVSITLAWSSWAAYPFMSAAVNPRRKALALYPVFLMYISVGFFIIAID